MLICPECGAHLSPNASCQAFFDECISLEFLDPAYGAVHHLTVATYMLQHSSKLSSEGWLAMRQLLREFLVEKKNPAEVRKQHRNDVDNGRRKWKITSRDGMAKFDKANWTRTIAVVRLENAAGYCADIIDWASTALQDAEMIEPG